MYNYREKILNYEEWEAYTSPEKQASLKAKGKTCFFQGNSYAIITRPMGIIDKVSTFFQLAWASFMAIFSDTYQEKTLRLKAWDAYDNNQIVRVKEYIPDPLQSLPQDVVKKIIDFLDIPDKKLFSQTASSYHALTQEPESWKTCADLIDCQLNFVNTANPITIPQQIKDHIIKWRENVKKIPNEMEKWNNINLRHPIPNVFYTALFYSDKIEDVLYLQNQYKNFFYSRDKLFLWHFFASGSQLPLPWGSLQSVNLNTIIPLADGFDKWCVEQTVQPLITSIFTMSFGFCWCKFSTVPSQIGYLTGLTELKIRLRPLTTSDVQFEKLPREMSQLKNLRKLQITAELTELPDFIGELKTLEDLNVANNAFKVFPDVILELRSLTSLDISHNKLKSIPSEISVLTELRTLDVRSNRLTELPREMGQLTNLHTLHLVIISEFDRIEERNQFKKIPEEILWLPNLTIHNFTIHKSTLWKMLKKSLHIPKKK